MLSLSAELLDVDQACAAFPREAEDNNLTDLAARWGVTFVRCIILDKDSFRIADEIANLSMGCQGVVHQFALKTGVPHFVTCAIGAKRSGSPCRTARLCIVPLASMIVEGVIRASAERTK